MPSPALQLPLLSLQLSDAHPRKKSEDLDPVYSALQTPEFGRLRRLAVLCHLPPHEQAFAAVR